MEKNTFYVTTPIYYPSNKLHIGNAYCTTAADAIARFKRLTGYDVMFLTGTDEHGQKIERIAREKGMEPIDYVDGIVASIKDLWKLMDISYDDFIRTTEPRHMQAVQKIFKRLYDQGDIYKSEYEGWYCSPCESFWLERQLVDGKCPDCGRPVERVKEESYFLRLSKYQDRLIEYINNHPDFIQPVSRRNEMLNNFLLPGLEDLAVSRTSFSWGIPVEFDPGHVVYVWLDALTNYITALGYLGEDDSKFKKYWPADVHLVGKEIVRFHTIIWPIVLMALDLPLPKQVYGHGWLILDGGEKMSKSKGNVIDPVVLVERYGLDAIRYFLLREMPLGSDGVFTNEILIKRINTDLANDLGNLVSRTVAMIEKYFDGSIPPVGPVTELDKDLQHLCMGTPQKVEELMDQWQLSAALGEIWKLVARCNKYIDETAPWALAKDEQQRERLATVMVHLVESIRAIGILIGPFMTKTPAKIFEQIGIEEGPMTAWDTVRQFGVIPAGTKVKKGEALFPRLDMAKELEALDSITPGQAHIKGASQKKKEAAKKQEAKKPEEPKKDGKITIDDFAKVEMKVASVLACEAVEGSEKLLKFTLKVGEEQRTVVSGIKKWYPEPEKLVGRQLILVANLKPAKLKGILSEGMLLSAEDASGNVRLLTVESPVEDGAGVS